MDPVREAAPVGHPAIGRGVLDKSAEAIVMLEQVADVSDPDFDAQRSGSRPEDLERLGMAALVGQKDLACAR